MKIGKNRHNSKIEEKRNKNAKIRYEIAKWRWEFMRRSEGYRADYERVLELRRRAKYPPDLKYERVAESKLILVDHPYYYTEEGKEERSLCAKYGIGGMSLHDPDQSFEDLVGPIPEWDQENKSWVSNTKGTMLMAWRSIKAVGGRGVNLYSLINDRSLVTIEIDFKRINSLPALKSYILELIDEHVEEFPIENKKRNIRDYEKIITIGENANNLRLESDNWTDQALAAELLPDHYKRNPNSAMQRIRQLIRDYEYFIDEGYREITYP